MENIKLDKNDRKKTLEMIYERTYAKAYVIAKQFVKNEEDALDVLQEAYISVFNHMESLQDESKLDKWVNMIVANRCKDWLRKKQVVLFSDIGEEAEGDYEATIEDSHLEFLPEASVDYAETKRLMAEILDALPEDQKMCILMYYYDELSVNEIAEGLGCSTGTVKSRLNYARKKIKEEVELLEKKGTKLYGVAPLPFIVWMLKGTEANATDSLKTAGILQKVVNVSASGKSVIVNSIPATRNITRKMVFGILKTKKTIAIISSLVVLGAGTTTYLVLRNDSNGNQHDAQQESMSKEDEETIKEDDGLKDTAVSEEIKETENTDITDTSEDSTTATDTTTTTNQTNTSNKTETSQPATKPTTPTGKQTGLYQNDVLVKDWNTLIAEEILSVNNGVLTSGYSYETHTNSSSDKLVGTLIIDESVKKIGEVGFNDCVNLTSVEIPDSVTSIGYSAFGMCSSLISVNIPNSVTNIEDYAFEHCINLKKIEIPENVTSISEGAFMYTSLISVNIPNSVTSIGGGAFHGCDSLISVNIPNSVTSIGAQAFEYCMSLKSIEIPDSVTRIDTNTFNYCTNLTSITIPSGVTNIGVKAFNNCSALTTINYKGSETDWNNIAIEQGAIPDGITINFS